MPVRDTSILAYNTIKANGMLAKGCWRIYSYLYRHGPKTAREVFEALGLQTNQSGRFTVMHRWGVIRPIRKRVCTVTTFVAYEWDVTSKIPKGTKEPKSTVQELREENQALREENLELRMRLYGRKATRRRMA